MHKLGTIREFKTQNFHVIIDAVEEDSPDISFDETGETQRQIENGSLILFCCSCPVFLPRSRGCIRTTSAICIYKSLEDFADHKECGAAEPQNNQTRRTFPDITARRDRTNTACPHRRNSASAESATRERAELWAKANATEAYDIFETGKCGSYFADMIAGVCHKARKTLSSMNKIRVREVSE